MLGKPGAGSQGFVEDTQLATKNNSRLQNDSSAAGRNTGGSHSSMRRRRDGGGGERGIAVLLTALFLVGLIPVAGLAIDASVLYAVKAKLSTACDAAALAAARSLSRGLTLADQQDAAVARAQAFFAANLPAGYLLTNSPTVDVQVVESGYRTRTVTVNGAVNAPVFFMSMLGFRSATVRAIGAASRRDVNLVLVLDHSSSMNSSGSCQPMKDAATYFVNQFANGRDRLSVVTFGNQYYPGYGPAMSFLTDAPSLPSLIQQITCGSNTNSATAYSEAYKQLVNLAEPGALNVIVFFTDGLANGITATFPVRLAQDTRYGFSSGPSGCTSTGSTCTMPPSTCTWPNSNLTGAAASYQQSWSRDHLGATYGASSPNPFWVNAPDPGNTYKFRTGVIAQWSGFGSTGTTAGLWTNLGTAMNDTSDNIVTSNTGCGWASNTQSIRRDLAYIPTTDIYGNRTSCCYKNPAKYSAGPYQGKIRIDKPITVGDASMNAVDDAALTARNNTDLGVVTYSIALGDEDIAEAPDNVLLMRMANDPVSPTFDNTKLPGLFVFAPDNTQLHQAFARIASEILRISL
jgi:Flp pilus assembly protein TadG